MTEKEQLLNRFGAFIRFADSLRELDDRVWEVPIRPGKWAIRDIIAHIMLWDQYFLEEAIGKIASGRKLTVKHLDYDDFNRGAVEYAKSREKNRIIDRMIQYRTEIVFRLKKIPDADLNMEHIDGDGEIFTVEGYLNGFIAHDDHHRTEIEQFLACTSV